MTWYNSAAHADREGSKGKRQLVTEWTGDLLVSLAELTNNENTERQEL